MLGVGEVRLGTDGVMLLETEEVSLDSKSTLQSPSGSSTPPVGWLLSWLSASYLALALNLTKSALRFSQDFTSLVLSRLSARVLITVVIILESLANSVLVALTTGLDGTGSPAFHFLWSFGHRHF